ncbi:MAG: RnfABCDGE type electron transport complex subunit D [Chitinispirillales bacterium]|jgi:electron transport complex protein RnfD|nr:RnfABCDGE type electron transport complex subunit D [Chitinispirillales bacterium]
MSTEESSAQTGGAPAGGADAANATKAVRAFDPPFLHLSTPPHIRSNLTVSKIMLAVIAAMVPALAASVVFFGVEAALLPILVCIVAAVATECVANLILRKGQTTGDFSAVVTGMLVAFNLPPALPLWMAALGSVFAIAVAKMVFGGLGCNFINPALAGRAFLVASYPAPMTSYPPTLYGSVNGLAVKAATATDTLSNAVSSATSAHISTPAVADSVTGAAAAAADSLADTAALAASKLAAAASSVADTVSAAAASAASAIDAVSSATPLYVIKHVFAMNAYRPNDFSPALKDLFFGNVGGCIGETSALALLIGGIFLMLIRAIDFRVPFAYIFTVFTLFWLANGTGAFFTVESLITPTFHILAGGLFLGAFFMATDPVTSPITPLGRLLFGIGCGALTFTIRKYGGYPEGVSFSILLMNLVAPLIDRCTRPKIYGEVKKHG